MLQDESPDEFTWLTTALSSTSSASSRMSWARGWSCAWVAGRAPTGRPRHASASCCIADIFELTARKQTAYACLIRAYRSVRLLEAGDSATVFRFAELFRYVAEEGQRLSPWLSFDEAVINDALATRGEADDDADEEDELIETGDRAAAAQESAPAAAATATATARAQDDRRRAAARERRPACARRTSAPSIRRSPPSSAIG